MPSSIISPGHSGVALDLSLSSSAAILQFTMKMFLAGKAVLPREGIAALPAAIAASLPAGTVQTGVRVRDLIIEDRRATGVRANDAVHPASAVVVATDAIAAYALTGIEALPRDFVGCVTVFLRSDIDPGLGNRLLLDGTGRHLVSKLAPLSSVQPTYAPAGQHLLAAVILDQEALDAPEEALIERVSRDVRMMLETGAAFDVLRVVRVPQALYAQPPGIHRTLPDTITGLPGLFLAGDVTVDASVNGAILGGEAAAGAVHVSLPSRPVAS